jgi:ABC-type transporter Mla maintaining outer membrane lipid asymmetry permease subunit MlaE
MYDVLEKLYFVAATRRRCRMSENDTTTVAAFLKNHPRAMGVVFTALLLLSSAGSAMAANAGSVAGP